MRGATDEQVREVEDDVKAALGGSLESLEVRLVTMKFEDACLPAEAPGEEEAIYVQYRLNESDVVVADVVGGASYGMDPASTGMLPTQGSLKSRMTMPQFERFLKAYAAETATPLGSVRRYDDRSDMMPSSSMQDGVLRVGKKKYNSSDVWAATEGMLVDGDEITMQEMGDARKAYIFYENPKTGAFTFLGTEPSYGSW